jgi:hypothetical protein
MPMNKYLLNNLQINPLFRDFATKNSFAYLTCKLTENDKVHIKSNTPEKEFFAAINGFDPEYSKTIALYEQTAKIEDFAFTQW